MYMNQKLLNWLYQEEKIFKDKGVETYIQKEPVGTLVVVGGTIILADPYAINYGVRLQQAIPDGVYEAWLYSASDPIHGDKRNAALLIRFRDDIPQGWAMCMPEHVEARTIAVDGYYGVSTQSGNLAVLTEKTCAWLLENPGDAETVMEAIEEGISLTFFEIGGVANVTLPDMEANVLTVVGSGEESAYPVYWGLDTEGNAVSLAIDFMVF